ncbi:MAG: type III polyketide synthase [Planctomycetota bacterium]|jgi:predicted naringenin-chalcone synthase
MTLALDPAGLGGQLDAVGRPAPTLRGLGCVVPDRAWSRDELAATAAEQWGLKGSARARWRRIIAASGIERRYIAPDLTDVMHRSTGERMDLYRRLAPPLASRAASAALANAATDPTAITDLVVVSCTGFAAPGVDVDLIERLGLRPEVRRSLIGFMGCFGAITGLRAAAGACSLDPEAIALVVCVELCSLHLRSEHDGQGMVATALFADGAGAAVVAGARAGDGKESGDAPIGRLGPGASLLLPDGRDWMTWLVTDTGFAMTLSKRVPQALGSRLEGFVAEASLNTRPRTLIVHPGGPGILDAVEASQGLDGGGGLESSRSVLRRYGNMSSATVLFVLEEAMRRGRPLPALLLAFGPGLTVEGLPVWPAGCESGSSRPRIAGLR